VGCPALDERHGLRALIGKIDWEENVFEIDHRLTRLHTEEQRIFARAVDEQKHWGSSCRETHAVRVAGPREEEHGSL
jgi:hypothetical protein